MIPLPSCGSEKGCTGGWVSCMCKTVDNFIWDLLSHHLAGLTPSQTNHRGCLEQMSAVCCAGNTWSALYKKVGSELTRHRFHMEWHGSPKCFHFGKCPFRSLIRKVISKLSSITWKDNESSKPCFCFKCTTRVRDLCSPYKSKIEFNLRNRSWVSAFHPCSLSIRVFFFPLPMAEKLKGQHRICFSIFYSIIHWPKF